MGILKYFENLGKAFFGQLIADTLTFLKSFVKTDLGALATDAVAFVEASMPGAGSADKKAAAIAKLKADALIAGHDLETFALSELNFIIESGVQAVKNDLLATAAQTAAKILPAPTTTKA